MQNLVFLFIMKNYRLAITYTGPSQSKKDWIRSLYPKYNYSFEFQLIRNSNDNPISGIGQGKITFTPDDHPDERGVEAVILSSIRAKMGEGITVENILYPTENMEFCINKV